MKLPFLIPSSQSLPFPPGAAAPEQFYIFSVIIIILEKNIYFFSNISVNIAYHELILYNLKKSAVILRKDMTMNELSSCKQAIENCRLSQTFAIAHLYKEEKTMDMHIHDCHEIYYSISGGKQFLIDNKLYAIEPGNVFVINQYESHKITQVDKIMHERIVLSIHPEYTKRLTSRETDLDACFSRRSDDFSHKISLSRDQQKRFLYYINKITNAEGYGHDILEQTAFMELLVLLNRLALTSHPARAVPACVYNQQVDDILAYINLNITSPITIGQLAGEFYLSESYICRIFKSATGTTINKYITARRISIAKSLLSSGASAMEAYEKSGFSDYSNFFKAFTRAVGISPKKYAQYSVS